MDASKQRRGGLESVAAQERLDALAGLVDKVAGRVVTARRRPMLEGHWLGHALHPMMTDLPIGCWTSAFLLDIFGGREGGRAARRLTLLGVLSAAPTIASGLAEWRRMGPDGPRRIAAVHASSGALATACSAMSWWRRGRHPWRGRAWGLAGAAVATVAGHLGGHLAMVEGVGAGPRDRAERSSTQVRPVDSLPAGCDVVA